MGNSQTNSVIQTYAKRITHENIGTKPTVILWESVSVAMASGDWKPSIHRFVPWNMGGSCVDLPTDSSSWCDVRWFQFGSMVVTRDIYIYVDHLTCISPEKIHRFPCWKRPWHVFFIVISYAYYHPTIYKAYISSICSHMFQCVCSDMAPWSGQGQHPLGPEGLSTLLSCTR